MVDDTRRQPRSPESVQSVDRAVDLLEALAGFEGPVGVGELAAATGLLRRAGQPRRGRGGRDLALAPAERFNGGREPGLAEATGRVAQRFADELLGP